MSPSTSAPNAALRSVCIWAVAMPSRYASPAKSPPALPALHAVTRAVLHRVQVTQLLLVAASDQPSEASRRYLDRIARPAGTPSSVVSIQPNGSATCCDPSRARAVVTSRSGFGPGDSRRNTLRIDFLAVHQAGVALLAAEHQAVEPGLEESAGIVLDLAACRSTRRRRCPRAASGELCVVQPVVRLPSVIGRAYAGVLQFVEAARGAARSAPGSSRRSCRRRR